MRQHLTNLMWASCLAGCSLIYNPSNLPDRRADGGPDAPPIDAPIDAPISDANPLLLQLDVVKSPALLEGAGQGGSAPQVLVVYGMHILKSAQLTVAPTTANTNVMLQVTNVSIAEDGNSIAALVRAGYMDTVDETGANESEPIPLTITVTQPGADPKTIAWSLRPLDELTATGVQPVPAADKLYSRVEIAGDIDFPAGGGRAIIRAVGSIAITQRASANASGQTGGAGGCNGGGGGADGLCHGGGKGAGGGGGGAGFVVVGGDGANNTGGATSGDALIKIYDGVGPEMNKGAGGGGGGGAGGGGGGTIELTAGGDITVGTVEANAAAGANGGLGSGGGGGAGGVVVMRAGGMLTFPTALSVAGGGGAGGTLGSGGNGSIGRWRVDAANTMGTPPAVDGDTPAPRRGPMIVRPGNLIAEINKPTLMISGKSGDSIQLITLYPDGTSDTKTTTMTSDLYPVVPPTLAIGLNTVCVIVPGGNFANDEAKNCIDLAFIP